MRSLDDMQLVSTRLYALYGIDRTGTADVLKHFTNKMIEDSTEEPRAQQSSDEGACCGPEV
jgi:hypothetical protein